MRYARLMILALFVLPNLAACGGAAAQTTPNTEQPAITQAASVAQAPTSLPDVVARVNDEPITFAEFDTAFQRRQQELGNVADMEALQTVVLTELINQRLVRQEAERMGIRVTDAELDAEVAQLKGIVNNDEDAWNTWLTANGYTEAQLRAELRAQMVASRVRDTVVGDAAAANTRQVQARHILVATREEAATVRARIAGGESFVDLAAETSLDVTTRNQGGDLGWFTPEGLLEPVVAEVAFSQEAGDISEPVATRLGWHIIETLAFDNLPLPPEKQAEVAQVVFDEWLTTVNDSAIIEIYW